MQAKMGAGFLIVALLYVLIGSLVPRLGLDPPAQVALNWLLNRPGITAPIVGARTMEQFDDNMTAIGWTLHQDRMDRLNAVSERPLPFYPYGMIETLKR